MLVRPTCGCCLVWVVLFGCSAGALAQTAPATRLPARTAARGDTRTDNAGSTPTRSTRLPDARGKADTRSASEQNKSADAQAPAGQRQPAGPIVKQIAPQAPFQLTETQQELLDQILAKWQKHSDKVDSFRCSFTRWEYDKAFGNPSDNFKKSQGQGEIPYS